MTDRKELVKDFIQNNPSLSGNEAYKKTVENGYGIRKQDFYKEYRKIKNLPEPTARKKAISIPIKYKKPSVAVPKVKIPSIPYEQTKFGKMAKSIQKKHGISEQNAIERTRALLKIRKRDYRKLNQKDRDILTHYGY